MITELGAIVKRVEYRSRSGIDNSPTVVSGIVVTPKGPPPPGGWTTIAFGHGTTGVLDNCGPSEYVNLIGSDEIIAALVLNGFAVAMSAVGDSMDGGIAVLDAAAGWLDEHFADLPQGDCA